MAVNIDTVYQKVLAMANKEQRGYITPQEFNLYADQAQTDIFERYFHDIRQAETRMETSTEFSSSLDMLEEKLNVFKINDHVLYADSYDGTITLPEDLYRLGDVIYCKIEYGTGSGTYGAYGVSNYLNINIEEIHKKDIGGMLNTIHTRPSETRPAFVRLTDKKIKIYPNHSNPVSLSEIPYENLPGAFFSLLGAVTFTSGSTLADFTSGTDDWLIMQYYSQTKSMPKIIDGNKVANLYSISNMNTYIAPNTFLLAPFPEAPTVLRLSNPAIATGTSNVFIVVGNVKCNYIKKPVTPNWAYVEINGGALNSPGNSINFELHSSEESALVSRILQLAGITLKDNNLLQIAGAEEGKIIQNQKQ